MTPLPCDVAVVGGGPAGLAAAAAAAGAGREVVLLDAGSRLGGQYWRHPAAGPADTADLHHDLATFRDLLARVRSSTRVLSGCSVWSVSRDGSGFAVRATCDGAETQVRASALVLAPGAYDRQLPFPGWDLPGVMTAGGAQALLKGNGTLPGHDIVVSGTGPFLLPVAAGLAGRGARVAGLFEANSPRGWWRGVGAVARTPGKLVEGSAYAAALARHRVPYRTRHAVIAAHGSDQLQAVTVARLDPGGQLVPGSHRTVACDTLAVGWGFTPQLELPLALGVKARIDVDGSLVVAVDDRQASSVPGVYVAGEATGVGGAALAVVEGEIAGLSAAGQAQPAPVPDRLRGRRRALRAFAVAMHRAYPVPAGWVGWLTDETLVCRCEEVSVADVRAAVHDLGATDARSVKLLSRVGMGWCQGRVCGYAAACLVAVETGTPANPRAFAGRPIAAPVPLGVLAAGGDERR